MSGQDDAAEQALRDEMATVLVRLTQARRMLGQEEAWEADDLNRELQAVAGRIAGFSPIERRRMQPSLLALLDDVERTIAVFEEGLAGMRRDLSAANQGRTAGAAYRRKR
jgi:hypothetical protein